MSNPLIAFVAVAIGLTQGTLMFDAPDGWRALTPTSSMRVAEFELLRADGDPEDASLIVYYFGGSGGSVEANLERWLGQMVQPDGRPSRDVATTRMFEAGGLPITHLAVGGTYVAEIRPGAPGRYEKPGFKLEAAVVETPNGPYFVKLVGPARTIDRWSASVTSFLESVRYE